jgi:hypothetical protein
MTTKEETNSLKKTARIAGVLYLIIFIVAAFAFFPAGSIIVPGDATATANNIIASESLFRMSIVGWSVVLLTEVVLSVVLYVLLKPVGKTLALVMMFSRLAMTTIQGMNLLNHAFALLLVSGADYLTVFEPDQLHALVMLFLNAYNYGDLIWQLFFGLHLLLLGYLVYKSGYIPKIMGVLLVVAALLYLAQSYGSILLPKYEEVLAQVVLLTMIPELIFPLWLLTKGVKDRQGAATEAG